MIFWSSCVLVDVSCLCVNNKLHQRTATLSLMKILDQSSDSSLRNTIRPLNLVSTLLWNTLCCHISLETVFFFYSTCHLCWSQNPSAPLISQWHPIKNIFEVYKDLPHPFCLENQLPSQRKISNCSPIICPGQNQCFILWPFPFTSANLSILHKFLKSFKYCWGQTRARTCPEHIYCLY